MQFRNYLVSYQYGGSQWNLQIPATSYEDAQQRLGQLHFGKVEGEIVATVAGPIGFMAALATWVRNTLSKTS